MKQYGHLTMSRLDDLVGKVQILNDVYSKALATDSTDSAKSDEASRELLHSLAGYMVSHWDTISAVTAELSDYEDPYDGSDF